MAYPVSTTDPPRREEVLALDIATHTGFFSLYSSGTWDFTEGQRRNGNRQHMSFGATLMNYIVAHGIRQIVAEDVCVNRYFVDMRKLSEFRGILLEVCDELGLPEPEFVNVITLKKWATGDSRATKAQMMDACRERYNYQPPDDNAADACHLFYYYLRKHRL